LHPRTKLKDVFTNTKTPSAQQDEIQSTWHPIKDYQQAKKEKNVT
jgi:hypothetical protein